MFIDEIGEAIEKAKTFGKITNLIALSHEYKENMIQNKFRNNWIFLVKNIIEIVEKVHELKQTKEFEDEGQRLEA